MPEERKLVTVLFADIVGSTALGARHDPEVIRLTLARAFERLAACVAEHGGVVEKFIGDEIMAVFGIPAAHDDDADRAVRAAFALREALAELNSAGGLQLALRIGVNTGEVVTGGGHGGQLLVTGSVVNETARLRGAAAPGEIVAGTLTRSLTARTVRYAEPRHVDAKGLGAVEATTALALGSELPQHRRGLEGMAAPLIGRDDELRLLLDAYGRTERDRRASLATVLGVAGSGKSRLAQEFVARVGQEGVRRGRCLPYGQGITYHAVQGMLLDDAGITTSDTRDEALAKLRAAAESAIGFGHEEIDFVVRRVSVVAGLARLDEALAEVAEEEAKEELRWAVRRYFEGRSSQGPLVLLFEDIHWAESSLMDLIEHLADRARGPLFLLCLARPELLDARPGWGAAKTNATAIDLQPLSGDETRTLIGALLAIDGLPRSLRDELVARAEGNPLYVEEFLRVLIETGQIEPQDGRWVATSALGSLPLPPSLVGLISARLDQLPGEAKRALQQAAVVGRFFSSSALAALHGGSPAEALRELARRDLVIASHDSDAREDRPYRFKHALIRDVAYGAIPKGERWALHDRYGRWYEETLGERRDGSLEILAYHAEQAFLLAHELRLLARELGLPDTATLGERALSLLRPAARRARERADLPAALPLHERAAAISEACGAPPAVRLECQGFAAIARNWMRTTEQTREAIAALLLQARAMGPSEVLVQLLRTRALHEPGASEQLYEEAVDVARQIGNAELIAVCLFDRSTPASLRGDLAEAGRLAEEAIAFMRTSGATELLPRALGRRTIAHVQAGQFGTARRIREEALRLADEQGGRFARLWARFDLMLLERYRGAYGRALQRAQEAEALAIEAGAPQGIDDARAWIANIDRVAGDAGEARRELSEIISRTDVAADPQRWVHLAEELVRACIDVGDITAAERWATQAYALRERVTFVEGVLSTLALALVRDAQGSATAAEGLFREALRAAEATQWGVLEARVREDYGRFLLGRRQIGEARAQLERAVAFFSDPEAAPRRAELEALLRSCGEALAW